MRLYFLFVLHHFDVVIHLFERSQNNGLAFLIELGSTSTTEDLLHIEDTNVFVATCWTIVNFGAFDQDGVSRQVDTPSKCGRGTQYLDIALHKHFFDKISVFPQHTSVMGRESMFEQFFDLIVARSLNFFLNLPTVLTVKEVLEFFALRL